MLAVSRCSLVLTCAAYLSLSKGVAGAREALAGYMYVGDGSNGHEIALFDPSFGDFVHEWTAQTAEGCSNCRGLGDRIYAPSSQVLGGVDYSVGLPWEDGDVPDGLHLYDINMDEAGNLWLAGSSGPYATLWRGQDRGSTWEVSLQVGLTIGTFSRFFFVGAYDGKVHVQAVDGS